MHIHVDKPSYSIPKMNFKEVLLDKIFLTKVAFCFNKEFSRK